MDRLCHNYIFYFTEKMNVQNIGLGIVNIIYDDLFEVSDINKKLINES